MFDLIFFCCLCQVFCFFNTSNIFFLTVNLLFISLLTGFIIIFLDLFWLRITIILLYAGGLIIIFLYLSSLDSVYKLSQISIFKIFIFLSLFLIIKNNYLNNLLVLIIQKKERVGLLFQLSNCPNLTVFRLFLLLILIMVIELRNKYQGSLKSVEW